VPSILGVQNASKDPLDHLCERKQLPSAPNAALTKLSRSSTSPLLQHSNTPSTPAVPSPPTARNGKVWPSGTARPAAATGAGTHAVSKSPAALKQRARS